MMKYKKSVADLEKVAIYWWPKSLEDKVAEISSLPKLIESQDDFLSILKLSKDGPEHVFDIISATGMSPNLFIKHLAVLSDFGGEPLQRLGKEFAKIFPADRQTGKRQMQYVYDGIAHYYQFKALPIKGLNNSKLKIDGKTILQKTALSDLAKDVIMVLLFGGASTVSDLASLSKCEVGGLLGKNDTLESYVRQRYISVSKITSGANTNSLGQVAQIYVADHLRANLDQTYSVQSNGKVKLRSYDKEGGMPFDVVVRRNERAVGIEVSFQVTSNSVIERKASLAEDRLTQMQREGHYIAYVLDGAGNFSRSNALQTLCASSDCTVAYSDSELNTLVDFIRGKLDDSIR